MSTIPYNDDASFESVHLLNRELQNNKKPFHKNKSAMSLGWRWLAHIILLTFSLTALFAALSISQTAYDRCTCEKYPATTYFDRHVDNTWEEHRFTDDAKSPYHGPPNPKVDTAWLSLFNVTQHTVDFSQIHAIGAPKESVRVPKTMGGQYMANIAVFHQLHCVNILWQYTYLEYYRPLAPILQEGDEKVHQHLDHCADIVRQALMCHADTNTLTYSFAGGKPKLGDELKENHTLPRMCRNYGRILEWAQENEVKWV